MNMNKRKNQTRVARRTFKGPTQVVNEQIDQFIKELGRESRSSIFLRRVTKGNVTKVVEIYI